MNIQKNGGSGWEGGSVWGVRMDVNEESNFKKNIFLGGGRVGGVGGVVRVDVNTKVKFF